MVIISRALTKTECLIRVTQEMASMYLTNTMKMVSTRMALIKMDMTETDMICTDLTEMVWTSSAETRKTIGNRDIIVEQ